MDRVLSELLSERMGRSGEFSGDFVSWCQWTLSNPYAIYDLELATGRATLWFSMDRREPEEEVDPADYHFFTTSAVIETDLLNRVLRGFYEIDLTALIDNHNELVRDGFSVHVVGRREDAAFDLECSNPAVDEWPQHTRLLAILSEVTRSVFDNVRNVQHLPFRFDPPSQPWEASRVVEDSDRPRRA